MPERRNWAFIGACALVGAVAVPFTPVATCVSAAFAAVLAAAGLRVWQWSRLRRMAAIQSIGPLTGPERT